MKFAQNARPDPSLSNAAILHELAVHEVEWRRQLAVYHDLQARYFAAPDRLGHHYRLQYLALRRGILNLESWLAWAAEVRETIGADGKAGE